MRFPSIFWVLHNGGDQSDDSLLGKVGQERLKRLIRKIKVNSKTSPRCMWDYSLYWEATQPPA